MPFYNIDLPLYKYIFIILIYHYKSMSYLENSTVHLDGAHVEVHDVAGRGERGQGQGRVRLLAAVPRPEHGEARPLRLSSFIEQVWKYSTEVQID